ncbi:hypothetical protein ACH5RR_033576 [Cinchona calisaya]|uniref:Pectinesterase inhibitor domain-containing protein n=1 Tax=Cinchona calisaya TaxID=153742 RepID=A0ABD2YQB9_9GENT
MIMSSKLILHCFALLIMLAIFLPLSSCDVINYTCRKTPNFQLCTSILRSNPKSGGTDVTGLGLIMVGSLESKANSALQTIKLLLKTEPHLKIPLTQCIKKYSFILKYDVTEAFEALRLGDPKFGEDSMNDSAMVVQECEDGFKHCTSPISNVNKDAHDISAVAAAIIRLLL